MEKTRARTFTLSMKSPVVWAVLLEAWRKVASTPGDLVDVLIATAGASVLTGVFGSQHYQSANSAPLADYAGALDPGILDRPIQERRASFPPLSPGWQQTARCFVPAELQLGNRMHDRHGMFAHRENGPASFDSICLRCYRTIATRERESDLRLDEENHVCRDTWQHSSRTPRNRPQ